MNAKSIEYIILTLLFLYEVFNLLIRKNAGNRMIQRYTEESLKKYTLLEGIACIIGAIGSIAFLLGALGIIDYGFDITGKTKEAWIVRGIWLALVLIPSIVAMVSLKKRDQASSGNAGGNNSSNNSSKKADEEEDY